MLARRRFLLTASAATALSGSWQAATAATLPPATTALRSRRADAHPISLAERESRLDRARSLMHENQIGAIALVGGTSLLYFTGIRWGNSERLFTFVLPQKGNPFSPRKATRWKTVRDDVTVAGAPPGCATLGILRCSSSPSSGVSAPGAWSCWLEPSASRARYGSWMSEARRDLAMGASDATIGFVEPGAGALRHRLSRSCGPGRWRQPAVRRSVVIFSISVIEHFGSRAQQARFASGDRDASANNTECRRRIDIFHQASLCGRRLFTSSRHGAA
jgi:hypothetical protein